MIDVTEVKEKSPMFKINGRDILRGLLVAAGVGALTVITTIDDVREFGNIDIWYAALNSAWKGIVSYIVLNFFSK